MEKPKIPLAVVIGAMVLGVGLLAFGLWLLVDEVVFAFKATRGEGVVQTERRSGKGKEPSSATVAIRVFHDGRSLEYQTNPFWTKPKPGETVALLFVPQEVESARIDHFAERYLWPILLLAPAVVLLGLVGWDARKRLRYRHDVHDRDRLTPALWKRW